MPQKCILVTGSSGFVGQHLLRRLNGSNHRIIAVDKEQPPTFIDEVHYHTIDLSKRPIVDELIADTSPDTIFHLAAQTSVAVSSREPIQDIQDNVTASVSLIQSAVHFSIPRIVFTSTGGAMYGDSSAVPFSESTSVNPQSIYGVSKLAVEHYLRVLTYCTETAVSVVRPGNIYGPGQNHLGEAGVIAIFGARMLSEENVTIFGDGNDTRDYIYVDDVVNILMAAGEQAPDTCLAGTGIETSTNQIFALLASAIGYGQQPIHAPARAGDVRRSALDSDKAGKVWGWTPTSSLSEGIAKTVVWLKTQQ